jgi:tetratricopeptide (TPR) repeat protein
MNPFKDLNKSTRTAIGYGIVAFLVGLGILAFFILQNRIAPTPSAPGTRSDPTLQDGINRYRKGDYEQARMFLTNVVDTSRDRGARSTALLYLGNIAYREEKYEDALSFFRRSIAVDDENQFAPYNTALAYVKIGDLGKAQKYARDAVQLSGEDSRAGLLLANIYFSLGRLQRASQLYGNLTHESGISRYNLALTLYRNGRNSEATDMLGKIGSADNRDALLAALAAYAAARIAGEEGADERQHREGSASEYMEQAFLMFGAHPSILYNYVLFLLHEQRYEESIRLMKSVRSNRDLSPLLGYALFKHGAYSEALPIWEDMLQRNENDTRIAIVLGDIHFRLENWDEAAAYYQKAVQQGTEVHAYGSLVQTYVRAGDMTRALQVCEAYVEEARDELDPLLCLADLNFYLGRRSEATKALEKALRLAGGDEQALERIAVLYTKHGMHSSALRLYGRILSENPERTYIHGKIAEIYLSTGHEGRASEQLKLFLKDEKNSDILYNAAVLLAAVEGGAYGRELLEQLAQDSPERFEAFYNEAVMLFQDGEYMESLRILEDYLEGEWELEDEDASLMHTLSGVASVRLGLKDRAALHFSEAVALNENNELAALNQKLIQDYPF